MFRNKIIWGFLGHKCQSYVSMIYTDIKTPKSQRNSTKKLQSQMEFS